MRIMSGLAVALLALSARVCSQELNCDVTVNVENIPSAQRDFLTRFEADVERYLNNTRWSDEDFGGEKIDCSMTIFFLTAPSENRYTAQVAIVSQRPVYNSTTNEKTGRNTQVLRLFDDRWDFAYILNQQMTRDDFRFEPLTGFLDYYAYLIVGMDLETYNEQSGSRYLQKALNVCNLAASTAFGKDWQVSSAGTYSRFGVADELMNLRYQPFRMAFHRYHFDGIDLLTTETQKGLDNILQAVEAIADLRKNQDPRSILVKVFFDAKSLEIADAFLPYPDRSVYDRLVAADPTHQSTYDEYRRKN
ncbi:MAG: DUF4835 family protein [Ignavibacteriales bacterium]|nr:DUF4835 family protein [Ignavibacteriales bacterium]